MLENARFHAAQIAPESEPRFPPETSTIKKASEILNDLRLEEKEREIVKLEQQIQELEIANAELGAQLKTFMDLRSVRERKKLIEIGVQTDPMKNSINVVVETKEKVESESSDSSSSSPEPEKYEAKDDFEDSEKSDATSSEASSSDSGTVEDIDERRSRRGSRGSTDSKKSDTSNKEEPATEPEKMVSRPTTVSSRVESAENIVIRLRAEIRNLRTKLATFERKNRVSSCKKLGTSAQ